MKKIWIGWGLGALVWMTSAQAAVPEYATLADRRAQLVLPEYTLEQKRALFGQSKLLLEDLFVHRDQKIAAYGASVDPIPLLEGISSRLESVTTAELQSSLLDVFLRQKDLHTNFYYPKPISCFRTMLPFALVAATNSAGRRELAVSSITAQAAVLELAPEARAIRVGDVLTSFDGRDPWRVVQEQAYFGAGSNADASQRRGIENATFRSGRFGNIPAEDRIYLRFRRTQDPSSPVDEEYEIVVPWVSRLVPGCLEPAAPRQPARKLPRDWARDWSEDDQQTEYRRFYGPAVARPRRDITPTAEPSIRFGKFSYDGASFGYLHISGFSPAVLSTEEATQEIRRILVEELQQTQGLVIDVRNNGGGSIGYAEGLVQLFTPHDVEGQGFRLKNSAGNRHLAAHGDRVDPEFVTVLNEAVEQGLAYTRPIPLTTRPRLNQRGQAYFKPVAVLTNASCYSACDMFTAQMQDHGAAKVFGEERQTGAGGANVVAMSEFVKSLRPGEAGPFAALPGSQDFRTAWRQSLRVGLHAGEVLEDNGVSADELVPPTIADVYSGSDDQMGKVARWLGEASASYTAAVMPLPAVRLDLRAGQPTAFRVRARGTDRVVLRLPDGVFGALPVPVSTEWTDTELDFGWRPANVGEAKRLDLIGYAGQAKAWRQAVSYRVVPAFAALDSGQAWTMDRLTVFNPGNAPADGWVIDCDKLRVGTDGLGYLSGVWTEASFFLDLRARATAKLSFFASLESEQDYDFFQVLAVSAGKEEALLGPVSGSHERARYEFDLSKYAGQNVELRFVFTSDEGVTSRGPILDTIELR